MTFNSAKLTSYILNKFGLVKEQFFKVNEHRVSLLIDRGIKEIKSSMFAKHLTAQEIATMILNEDNPKTMDYFFVNLLKVKMDHASVSYSGTLNASIKSVDNRISCAFNVLGRQRNFVRGQVYFTIDMHRNQIFPKSRSFRICGRRLLPISVKNPNAGKVKTVKYAHGYTSTIVEPSGILQPKHVILYCRNAWERKGEVKPSRAKGNKEEAVSTPDTGESVNTTDVGISVI
jgi:hypothetical protein